MASSTPVSSMDLSAIVESITCPITGDVMMDPVQGNDGQTYERSSYSSSSFY